MLPPPIPPDEPTRLAALRETRLLDTPPEPSFDDVVRVAATLCGAPIALVSLVDADRQWFKARVGLAAAETPREFSICAHGLQGARPFVVPDTFRDERFADNPLIAADPSIRFYAGVPLHVDEGSALGTLCVIDRVPRVLSEAQMEGLCALARYVAAELRQRRALATERASRLPPRALPVGEGDVVAGYRVGAEIGRGGAGVVMSGHGPDGSRVAIKFLMPAMLAREGAVARFVREARLLLRLEGPHVARVLDVGDLNGGAPYIVMEHLEGSDLAAVLDAWGPRSAAEAIDWTLQACAALEEAHALGVIHRDVKPTNLFLAETPAGLAIKVLDFGVAKDVLWGRDDKLTTADVPIGTPQYMPPEQAMYPLEVDARADIWSLGAVLYELLTDRAPFQGRSPMEVCAAILSRPPIPPRAIVASVPEAVERVVMRCLSKDRERRPASMGELARELKAARAAL